MPRRDAGEGSVYQRKDGMWVGMLDLGRGPNGVRRRKAVYGATKREALRRLGATRLELEKHGTLPGAQLTVERWMRTWLDDIASERVRETTLPGYRSKVEQYIIPAIGRHRLDKLQPEHLRKMYQAMADGCAHRGCGQTETAHGIDLGHPFRPRADATLLQTHRILSRALKVAMREGKVNRNVATLVDAPSKRSKKSDTFNIGEVAAILQAARGDRLESRWVVAMTLGIRQGEALGLGWEDVDLDGGLMHIRRALARVPKQGLKMVPVKSATADRHIPIPDGILASLAARRAAYETERQQDGYTDLGLVWARVDGRPTDPRSDYQAWCELLDRADVMHRPLHAARHSAATDMAALNVPPRTVMEILGHSQISLTLGVYTHADVAGKREALRALEASRSDREPQG